MEKKKRYELLPFLISVLFLFIALITPAVSFSNPAGSINLYLSGYLTIYLYGHGFVGVWVTNPEITGPSLFVMATLLVSLVTLSIWTYDLREDLENFKILNFRYFLLLNAIVLLISVIFWTIQLSRVLGVLPEELIELGYNNIWELFSPSFGLIGIFFAAGLILSGIIYIQFNYEKILGKLLPIKVEKTIVEKTIVEKTNELNIIYLNILNELDHMKNIAKERYIEERRGLGYLDTLNEKEMRKYNRLNRMADAISLVLIKFKK